MDGSPQSLHSVCFSLLYDYLVCTEKVDFCLQVADTVNLFGNLEKFPEYLFILVSIHIDPTYLDLKTGLNLSLHR